MSPRGRETIEEKAHRYLAEERLLIERVDGPVVRARCRGGSGLYELGFRDGRWYCGCPALTPECCHLCALRLVVRPLVEGAAA